MGHEYSSRYWTNRSSRRRFLAGASVAGAGAAAIGLVGCGDDNNAPGTKTAPAGTGSPAASASAPAGSATAGGDPYANAKKGGTFHTVTPADPPTIDPYGNLSYATKYVAGFTYGRLLKYDSAPGKATGDVRPTGDIAEKWEMSSDGTECVFTLRDGVTFQDIAPVSGRAVDIDDIKYSWGRLTAPSSQNGSQVAFVDKLEYPDAKSVKFTLKQPNAGFLDDMADTNLLFIMPKEADGGFDPAKKMIGSGPWQMDSYTPSSNFQFSKNPKWYVAGFPLLDKLELSIIADYAARKAQFVAGNIDATDLSSDDVSDIKSHNDKAQLYNEIAQLLSWFYFDATPDAPWNKDPRVRLAISRCIDRDALTDLAYNIKKLQGEGFDVKGPWNNAMPAGFGRWWLDPQSKEQGATAQNFVYDVGEAKKLLSAAGFADGISAKYQYPGVVYGSDFQTICQANIQFLNAAGIKTQTEVQNYQSQYITQTFTGNFTGIAFGGETPFPEGGGYPIRMFTPNPLNHGHSTDAKLQQLALAQQRELDETKRKDLFNQIQQRNAEIMAYVPNQWAAGPRWTGYREWIHNGIEIRTIGYGAATEQYPFMWTEKA